MVSLSVLHAAARRRLAEAGVATPELDARILVEEFSGTTRTDAVARPEMEIEPGRVGSVEAAVARRIAGEPVHRILGWREFFGLRLELSAETLEPRPDTETLVELALPFVAARIAETGACSILDLGTGTGAVALALLSRARQATGLGTDISAGALATAARNAHMNGLNDRFATVNSDWFAHVEGRFDAIVSNPPYVAEHERLELAPDVLEFDPQAALFGGRDGLDAYRAIAAGATPHLEPGGIVAVEIGHRQRQAVTALFAAAGWQAEAAAQDLGGRDRALLFRRVERGANASESAGEPAK